jgi:hypothetical protein
MQGGAPSSFMTNINDLPNISDFKDTSILPFLATGILFVDVFVLFLTRYYQVGGKSLNLWYDTFGLEGVIADVGIIFIGFLLAQYIYSFYVAPLYGWSPFLFVVLLVCIQLLHDLGFYYGVIKPIPKGHNAMIDTYKVYAEENGAKILAGDSLLMIGSAIATFGLLSIPVPAAIFVGAVTIYALPHILNTKMQPSTADMLRKVEKEKEEGKQTQKPIYSTNSWNNLMPSVQSTKVPAVEKPWL